jgi:hypothetical protein
LAQRINETGKGIVKANWLPHFVSSTRHHPSSKLIIPSSSFMVIGTTDIGIGKSLAAAVAAAAIECLRMRGSFSASHKFVASCPIDVWALTLRDFWLL